MVTVVERKIAINESVNSQTTSVTVAAGEQLLVAVYWTNSMTSGHVLTATYGAQGMTLLTPTATYGAGRGIQWYWLSNPTPGTADLVVETNDSSISILTTIFRLTGATTPRTIATVAAVPTTDSGAISASIATSAGELVLDVLKATQSGGFYSTVAADAGQTEIDTDPAQTATVPIFASTKTASGSSTTMRWVNAVTSSAAYLGVVALPSSGGSATITLSPDPASVTNGGTTQLTITRSTAAPAGAGVTYNLTSDTPAAATVPATVTMAEGQTTATFNVTGVSVGSSTITATNAADSGETDSSTVNVVTTRKLKLLAHVDALGATDVRGAVFEAPTGGALVGAKIGEFFGASFKATSESGKAPLEVDVADFGGEALTTSDTPVLVWEATSAAGSALGNAVPIGSTGPHECTVIEV